MKIVLLEKGRKSVPIGTRVQIPGTDYYREKTATGWKHVKVTKKDKKAEDEDDKKKNNKDEEEDGWEKNGFGITVNNTDEHYQRIEDELSDVKRGDELTVTSADGKEYSGKFGSYDSSRHEIRFMQTDKGMQIVSASHIKTIDKGSGEDIEAELSKKREEVVSLAKQLGSLRDKLEAHESGKKKLSADEVASIKKQIDNIIEKGRKANEDIAALGDKRKAANEKKTKEQGHGSADADGTAGGSGSGSGGGEDSKGKDAGSSGKKGRGRPKGSKNKPKLTVGKDVKQAPENQNTNKNEASGASGASPSPAQKKAAWLTGGKLTFEDATKHDTDRFNAAANDISMRTELDDALKLVYRELDISDLDGLKKIAVDIYENGARTPNYNKLLIAKKGLDAMLDTGYFDSPKYKAASKVYHLISAYQKAVLLDDPSWDGKFKLRNFMLNNNSIVLSMSAYAKDKEKEAYITDMQVDFEDVTTFLMTLPDDDKKTISKALEKNAAYKKWQLSGGDIEMMQMATNFQKVTGFEIAPAERTTKVSSLSKANVKKVEDVFKALKPVVDFTKYTPPDGIKLKVSLSRTTKKAAGFYNENSHTINISPTYVGTVTHEIGHYLWNRHPDMQMEFMQWAKNSGFMDKLKNNLKDPKTRGDLWIPHITMSFSAFMHTITDVSRGYKLFGDDSLTKRLLVNNVSVNWSDDEYNKFQDGFMDVLNIYRAKMEGDAEMLASGKGRPVLISSTRSIDNIKDADDRTLLSMAKTAMDYEGFSTKYKSEDDLFNTLKAVKTGLAHIANYANDAYTSIQWDVGNLIERAKNAPDPVYGGSDYRQKPYYWMAPTEMFARTFRNYCASKSGKTMYDTTEEMNSHDKGFVVKDVKSRKHPGYTTTKTVSTRRNDPFGYGFPEMDCTDEMIHYNNNELERILKKHIGASLVKSMTRLMLKLEKSEILADSLKREGRYKEGMRKTWTKEEEDEGTRVELEHTDDKEVARQIAMDHLVEDNQYYKKLAKMEEE